MLRRNFLRNAAFTLPVALVAPNALLANEQQAPQETDVIFIGAQDNQPNALPNETLVLSEARDIVCNNKGFELSDPNGNRYQTRKIVFAKSFTFCDTQARVHVQSSEAQSTTFSIKRNGRQSAVCWVASEGVHAQQVLPAFLGSPKAAILCMV